MDYTVHNSIVNFIWSIADDELRDVYVRGKYRDVILPMTVLRRLDVLLEPTKEQVLEQLKFLRKHDIPEDSGLLEQATGYPFYNISRFTLRRLLDEPQQIRANFEAYLAGFSPNVRDIVEKFKLHNQIATLVEHNRLYPLIQKFVSTKINLGPEPVHDGQGNVVLPGLTNRDMGYVFEELLRRFNEENNEEAGEHFTPRDIVKLMAHLIFEPIKDQIQSSTYLLYDDACGSGGMLTEAERFLLEIAGETSKQVRIEMYGQEVNPETYAICKADMLIKGENPQNIRYGSTLSDDKFPRLRFDFMLTNPPYGKAWKNDKEQISKGGEVTDPRFQVGVPRVSDGQLLFLVNMLTKMKHDTPLGSRIAIVHNGSALFTGDAGQGESEIRKWIIENDWLECIVGLPLNMFYNTGIATYIWVLTNRKPEQRRRKVQLIDATEWYSKLRRNLGQKNCELTEADIRRVVDTYLAFEETAHSRIFDNAEFGYRAITVERPLRLRFQVTPERIARFREQARPHLHALTNVLLTLFESEPHDDFNAVQQRLNAYLKNAGIKVRQPELKLVWSIFTEREPEAAPVIREQTPNGMAYEPDPELRDTERVPLKEAVEAYFEREVLPHVPDAWIDHDKTVTGYEISFTRYFYRYTPLRSLEEIRADILALEEETEGLLREIVDAVEVTA